MTKPHRTAPHRTAPDGLTCDIGFASLYHLLSDSECRIYRNVTFFTVALRALLRTVNPRLGNAAAAAAAVM